MNNFILHHCIALFSQCGPSPVSQGCLDMQKTNQTFFCWPAALAGWLRWLRWLAGCAGWLRWLAVLACLLAGLLAAQKKSLNFFLERNRKFLRNFRMGWGSHTPFPIRKFLWNFLMGDTLGELIQEYGFPDSRDAAQRGSPLGNSWGIV